MHAVARKLVAALAGSAALAGCTVRGRVPEARVTFGPARAERPHRIVALPATGGGSRDFTSGVPSASDVEDALGAVDSRVRMELEQRGWEIVDADRLNERLRERVETTRRSDRVRVGAMTRATSSHVERGPGAFVDSSPAVQDDVLRWLAIDTLLGAGVIIGDARLPSGNQVTTERAVGVRLTLTSRDTRETIVESTCSADAGAYQSFAQAVERATRCTLDGLLVALGQEPVR